MRVVPIALLLAAVACRDRAAESTVERAAPPPVIDAPSPPVIDAAPPPIDAPPLDRPPVLSPDEAARRANQPTGLGADRTAPTVVTESLVVALATGRAPLGGYLDAKLGAWELVAGATPRADRAVHRCGPEARALFADNLGRVVDRQVGGMATDTHRLSCDNAALVTADDGVPRHARCISPAADPTDDTLALVLVPDADRGVRFAAALRITPGADPARAWAALGRTLTRAGVRCR